MSNNGQFIQFPYELLKAQGFSNKEGKVIALTIQAKIIYLYMKQRWKYFTGEGLEYRDSLDSIADQLSINRKTVMSAVKVFQENGIITACKERYHGREKWFWKNFNDLNLETVTKATGEAKSRWEDSDENEPSWARQPGSTGSGLNASNTLQKPPTMIPGKRMKSFTDQKQHLRPVSKQGELDDFIELPF